jgi:hypothetical protein
MAAAASGGAGVPVEHVTVPREDPMEGEERETAIADAATAEVK